MCDPVSLTIATVASAGMSYIGQQQAAKAQEKANRQSAALMMQNQALQIRALQNAEDEDRERTNEDIMDNQKAADAARATAAVAAGESGVSGLSVDALLGDLIRQESENRGDILTSQDFRQRQRQLDREGIGITTQSQVNQLPRPEYPSFLGTALQAGIDGVNTYQSAKARQKK